MKKDKNSVTIKNKEYWKVKGKWISENKKGNEYTVSGAKILEKLDKELELSNQELKPSGFGDIISKVTKAVGVVECPGCERRKKYLNKFSWLKKSRDLTEDEEEFILDLHSRKQMSGPEQKRLFALYNEITRSRIELCACPGLTQQMIIRLEKFVEIL